MLVWIQFTLTACESNPQAAARKKLAGQNIGVSPKSLFKAIEMGDVKNTFLLLEAGIDINVRIDQRTPLIAAIELGEQKWLTTYSLNGYPMLRRSKAMAELP